ncbi:MAG TPA: ABC transporter permease [Puia sp.]|jgi:putative ABC transport system permease protein|nr:ABC transporter permease [Puia sp.]
MIKNYFKTAWRNFLSQKTLATINVIGLSVGLACFTLILLYTVNEFSYNSFFKNAKNIYRIYERTQNMPNMDNRGDAELYLPLGPNLKADFPDVKDYTRFQSWGKKIVKSPNISVQLPVAFADLQFFKIFSFKLLYGDASDALKDQHNVVITKDKALQLFGETNVVGKIILIKSDSSLEPFTVSAVADNLPANSSIQFDVLLSFDYFQTTSYGKPAVNNWNYSGFQTYIELGNNSTLLSNPIRLSQFRKKYFPDEEAQLKSSGAWNGSGAYPISFHLQPIRDIHTNLQISAGDETNIDTRYVWILLAIGAAILLIACINFTTLAIGRSAGRAKEVGLRKVMGSSRKQLMFQFLSEALFLTVLSAIIGLVIAQLLLPLFNSLAQKNLSFSLLQYPQLVFLFVLLIIIVALMAGSYPAVVLSRFNATEVIKNKIRLKGSNYFTKSLITLQFVISTGLIISTAIIFQQLHFMRSKNPGFNKENVVMIDAKGITNRRIYQQFKQLLSSQTNISGITASDVGLGEEGYNSSGFDYKGKHEQVFRYATADDYIKVLGMQLISGRNFNSAIAFDSTNSVIVNEALVKDMGLTDESILGLSLNGYSRLKDRTPFVIGVVNNFNFLPLKQEVKPILFSQPFDLRPLKFYVRIKPGNPSFALSVIKDAWNKTVADAPLQYSFLDDNLDDFYKSESRWTSIIGWAGGVTIVLACLGLFGLTALATVNRTKEIGVRKVLGASIISIIKLISKDMAMLVGLALIIAAPISWYYMDQWLQGYAYRIRIGWIVFAAIGAFAVLIALATISFQAIKAAMANPVKSLRTE